MQSTKLTKTVVENTLNHIKSLLIRVILFNQRMVRLTIQKPMVKMAKTLQITWNKKAFASINCNYLNLLIYIQGETR
jgi:hypothetical protein